MSDERAAHLDRLFQRIGPIGIDAELDVVARTLAQALDAPAGVLDGIGDLDLDARESGLEVARRARRSMNASSPQFTEAA